MAARKPIYYGWILLGAAWVCYGFGLAPSSYGWTLLAPTMAEDLGIDRGAITGVRSLRTFLLTGLGPIVGFALTRWGLRWVMTAGFVLGSIGLFYLSRAETLLDCYIGYGWLGGGGLAFATVLPSQTLASNWFRRYRARAMAILLSAGGIVGFFMTRAIGAIEVRSSWHEAWFVTAVAAGAVAVIAAIFIRNTPEEIGQTLDGDVAPGETPPPPSSDRIVRATTEWALLLLGSFRTEKPGDPQPASEEKPTDSNETKAKDVNPPAAKAEWTAAQAIRTPQFFLLLVAGQGYGVLWQVTQAHTGFHLRDLGFDAAARTGVIAIIPLVSILGRFSGALGDFIRPQRVLAVGLAIEALGMGALVLAKTTWIAYVAVAMVGIGFGASYITMGVVFADFFGRRAFATATGMRFFIGAILQAGVPILVGRIFDSTQSYTPAFLVLMGYGLFSAVIAFVCPRPGEPPGSAP